MKLSKSKFRILHLKGYPIYEQLQIEEALLRCNDENWCIINEGSTDAIVLGISGKTDQMVDLEKVRAIDIPLIKRYSGGGTVVVDENTLFVSLICKAVLHCPKKLANWAASLYESAINHPEFALKEHDCVIGEKKCGGNAQYLRKNRCVHHTTFLWDYDVDKMNLLKFPPKTPDYRSNRGHEDFVCRLSELIDSKAAMIDRLKERLDKDYGIVDARIEEVLPLLEQEHRRATRIL